MAHRYLFCGLLLLLLASLARAERPAVFADLKFEAAKAEAQKSSKLLVVDFTATWCGPCKQMDKDTWSDAKVASWLKEHAVAVQIDIDENPDLAKANEIQSIPAIFAFKEGKVFDKAIGYQDPAGLLGWLEGVQKGRRAIDAIREKAEAKEGPVDIQAKLDLASALLEEGKFDEATGSYAWLWEHMLENDPSYMGVRVSFMASEMTRLAGQHPPAMARFTALRDAEEKELETADPGSERRTDWLVLNEILGDTKSTLAWFDRIKDDPVKSTILALAPTHLQHLLEREKRWADLARLFPEPGDALANLKRMVDSTPDLLGYVLDDVSTIHAALLAAGRKDDAKSFVIKASQAFPDPSLPQRLVDKAKEAGIVISVTDVGGSPEKAGTAPHR